MKNILSGLVRLTVCIFLFILSIIHPLSAQDIPAGFPVLEELLRRNQLNGDWPLDRSFNLRPINQLEPISISSILVPVKDSLRRQQGNPNRWFHILPVRSTSTFTTKRPFGYGDGIMNPNVGFQSYLTAGIAGRFGIFRFRFQPEINYAQNKSYEGFSDQFTSRVIESRFRFWNTGDFPERFGKGPSWTEWWGQSSVSLIFGGMELGISSENIWWGPGQWNSLIFSNNAQGFLHLSIKSHKPLKTFLGNFETQLLSGRLESSGLPATQNAAMNRAYGRSLPDDWRYVNAFMVSYNPKWIPGMYFGISRSQQQYSEMMDGSFEQYFPVLESFQKVRFGFDRDSEGRDQQVSFFLRYISPRAKTEIYTEYGRRDHSYDWREFILNPEHARAFLLGFSKLVDLPGSSRQLSIRGEVVQQQEAVNRYIRYLGLGGNVTWHTHWTARGFTQYGQALGVGVGVGSNSQKLEIALVEGASKMGVLFERIVNHQDFYERAFAQQDHFRPWIDYSAALLWTKQMERVLINSKLNVIGAQNYQWNLNTRKYMDFPTNNLDVSIQVGVDLIYTFH